MNAVPFDAASVATRRVRLRPEYAGLTPAQLLAHLRERCAARWFAVPDPVESARGKVDGIVTGRFEFNGESHDLGETFDWLSNPSVDVEWHILLHKFYYATGLAMAHAETGDERYARTWRTLTASWIDATPPGFIAPDVTGRRVQNWIYAYRHFVGRAAPQCVSADFHERLLASLEEQVEYLCEHLTPKRNHRTLELYAIFLAGVAFPEFARAATWREFALDELVRNAAVDLLPDGVHCELSTDYHHLVVKNWLCVRRLAATNGIAVPPAFDAAISRALDFSMHVHQPSGVVPALSDGDARGFLELLHQGDELYRRDDWRYVASGGAAGVPPDGVALAFPDGGYVILRSGWGRASRAYRDEHHLVFDCGPLGEGNHGHLDCLSVELAANGRPLVVDPGRYTYSEAGEVNWRVHFRGTAAHSTVSVDGRQQTRYEPKPVQPGTRHAAGSVRHRILGPAPRVSLLGVDGRAGFAYAGATAASSEYPATHTRHVAFVFDRYWIVADRLTSTDEHRYDQRFQFAPEAHGRIACESLGRTQVLRMPGLVVAVDVTTIDGFAIEDGWVSREYGSKMPAPRLSSTRRARDAWFATLLMPTSDADGAPDVVVRARPLGDDADALALEVEIATGAERTRDVVAIGAPGVRDTVVECLTGGAVFAGGLLAVRLDASGRAHAVESLGAGAGAATGAGA